MFKLMGKEINVILGVPGESALKVLNSTWCMHTDPVFQIVIVPHDFKIWPTTFNFKAVGPVYPSFLAVKKSHFNKNIRLTAILPPQQNRKYM